MMLYPSYTINKRSTLMYDSVGAGLDVSVGPDSLSNMHSEEDSGSRLKTERTSTAKDENRTSSNDDKFVMLLCRYFLLCIYYSNTTFTCFDTSAYNTSDINYILFWWKLTSASLLNDGLRLFSGKSKNMYLIFHFARDKFVKIAVLKCLIQLPSAVLFSVF